MRPVILVLLFLTGCANEGRKLTASAADTTRAIELALKTVLVESFPEMDGIRRKSNFNDSIFLTTNLVSLASLPSSIDSFRFKILPDTMICAVIKSDTATEELPNYLRLQSFEKTDSGYFVQFESVDCIPAPSLDGSVSLHLLRTKDKFVFHHK